MWAFLRSWHFHESSDNSEVIHHNSENRYFGVSPFSLADFNKKHKQDQNFYKMLPEECSELQTVKSARKAIFSPKRMIKTETNSRGNYEVTYWSCSNPMAQRVTVCKSWRIFLENWMGCFNVAMNEWTIVVLVTAGITGKKKSLFMSDFLRWKMWMKQQYLNGS